MQLFYAFLYSALFIFAEHAACDNFDFKISWSKLAEAWAHAELDFWHTKKNYPLSGFFIYC